MSLSLQISSWDSSGATACQQATNRHAVNCQAQKKYIYNIFMGVSCHVSTLGPSRVAANHLTLARCFEKQMAWMNWHCQAFPQGFHVKVRDPRLTPSCRVCLEKHAGWSLGGTVIALLGSFSHCDCGVKIMFQKTGGRPNPAKRSRMLAL